MTDPFIHPLDSAFQEALALNHLKYGLSVTRGLATMAVVDGNAFHHAAHPPLLQLIYAGLYSIFGVHEWVSRLVSLAASLVVMICLWAALLKVEARRLALPAVIAFALMPLAVKLGRTTNYEPVSLAIISAILVAYLYRDRKWAMPSMCLLAVAGGLFEWTVYLAFPALAATALINGKKFSGLKPLVIPSLCAAATLCALFVYQHGIVGHVPVLGHAPVRSDPSAIFDLSVWGAAFLNLREDFGIPLLLVLAVGLIVLILSYSNSSSRSEVVLYFIFMPLIFLILAPQLVLAHPIAQYYLTPLFSLSFAVLVGRRAGLKQWIWIIVFSGAFIFHDVHLLKQTARFHYDLAGLVAQNGKNEPYYAFDSSAVGYLRYYHGVETIHAVGGNEPPPSEIVSMGKVEYFIVDRANREVDYVRRAIEGAEGLRLEWKFEAVEIWRRGRPAGELRLANGLDGAQLPDLIENPWEKPAVKILFDEDKFLFGIFHHPRKSGDSTIVFERVRAGLRFETKAILDPGICNAAKTDGVGYSLTIGGPEWFRRVNGDIAPVAGECRPQKIVVDLEGAPPEVDIMLTTTPMGNSAYDRFFWEDPKMIYEEE